ncbi:MAG: hypothetical protein MO853_04010 [Candidatus Protistobacter heckmanni]|nr:hypothetical protein [Candidatus Protistobacter heckmanni]
MEQRPDLGAESVQRYGHPYYTLYRAYLHRLLAEEVLAAQPGAVPR